MVQRHFVIHFRVNIRSNSIVLDVFILRLNLKLDSSYIRNCKRKSPFISVLSDFVLFSRESTDKKQMRISLSHTHPLWLRLFFFHLLKLQKNFLLSEDSLKNPERDMRLMFIFLSRQPVHKDLSRLLFLPKGVINLPN